MMQSNNDRLRVLEERVGRLEKKEQGWRRGFMAMAGVLALVVFVAAGPGDVPAVVQAKSFQMVNDAGRPLVVLASNDAGGIMMAFNNDGKPVALAGASVEGGVVGISSSEGAPIALMEATGVGGAISTRNNAGIAVSQIGARPDGGALVINNGDGTNNVVLRTSEHGGAVDINSSAGRRVISALASKSGGGMVLLDTLSKPQMTFTCGEENGIISLFGNDGKIRWQAPNKGLIPGGG